MLSPRQPIENIERNSKMVIERWLLNPMLAAALGLPNEPALPGQKTLEALDILKATDNRSPRSRCDQCQYYR